MTRVPLAPPTKITIPRIRALTTERTLRLILKNVVMLPMAMALVGLMLVNGSIIRSKSKSPELMT